MSQPKHQLENPSDHLLCQGESSQDPHFQPKSSYCISMLIRPLSSSVINPHTSWTFLFSDLVLTSFPSLSFCIIDYLLFSVFPLGGKRGSSEDCTVTFYSPTFCRLFCEGKPNLISHPGIAMSFLLTSQLYTDGVTSQSK